MITAGGTVRACSRSFQSSSSSSSGKKKPITPRRVDKNKMNNLVLSGSNAFPLGENNSTGPSNGVDPGGGVPGTKHGTGKRIIVPKRRGSRDVPSIKQIIQQQSSMKESFEDIMTYKN